MSPKLCYFSSFLSPPGMVKQIQLWRERWNLANESCVWTRQELKHLLFQICIVTTIYSRAWILQWNGIATDNYHSKFRSTGYEFKTSPKNSRSLNQESRKRQWHWTCHRFQLIKNLLRAMTSEKRIMLRASLRNITMGAVVVKSRWVTISLTED